MPEPRVALSVSTLTIKKILNGAPDNSTEIMELL